jgi:uncharacterized membrane protein YoaK (UPF0700 family)
VRRQLLKSLLRRRAFLESATLALALPFVAGMVNAEGFVIVGVYTSHVTGTVARAGHELARGSVTAVLSALLLVVAFYIGAVSATALVALARRGHKARYSHALAAEVMALITIAVIGELHLEHAPLVRPLITLLLCFSMGSQNALVTRLSGAIVRNTHLTGIVTDLGIETVQVLQWYRTTPGKRLTNAVKVLRNLRRVPELKRLRLHGAICASFFLGAVVGPLLYLREGYMAMLLPISVLTGLIIFDAAIGLRSDSFPSASADLPHPPNAEVIPGEGGADGGGRGPASDPRPRPPEVGGG